jgi:hypothetical protein
MGTRTITTSEDLPPRTTAELAEFLRLSPRVLTQWRYLGKGPRWIKVGRHVRYPQEDTQEWLDAGADSPDQARADAIKTPPPIRRPSATTRRSPRHKARSSS